jgi:hypothetical protein
MTDRDRVELLHGTLDLITAPSFTLRTTTARSCDQSGSIPTAARRIK